MAETSSTSGYSRINVQTDAAGVFELAQAQFAAKNKTVELVYNESSTSGDIVVLTNGATDTYGAEGYSITVDNGVAVVTAASNTGAFYGLQNALQQLEVDNTIASVNTTQPYKETRALFVDTARKYFGVSWFEEIIREMSWNGMNTLYISFSNDEGFRLLLDDMSLSFDDGEGNTITYDHEFMAHLVDNPETVDDSEFLTERNANATDEGSSRVVKDYDNNKYYTQDDMERILAYAEAYGIKVIPEFNSPGHFGQVMWYFPEYRIQGTWYEDGQPHYGLDLTNTKAYNFGTALVKKYIDFFAAQGCTAFCVGGDEYSAGNATNEQIAAYTNGLATYAEEKGMAVYAWNDGQAAANNLLKDSVIVNCWNGTSEYSLINFDSNYLYYVLKNYNWKPNAQTLYESWTPNLYNGATDLSAHIKGASLAIWCDVPNKETPAYVLESIVPDIQAFGYKMWNYSEVATTSLTDEYASYSDFSSSVTSAPNVAETTVLETVNYDVSSIPTTPVDELPEPSEGDGYELVVFSDISDISVSTTDGWWSGATSLTDEDTSTVAWTNGDQSVGDYMRVDLGSAQNIDTITVTSPAHGDVCTNANVQVSVDGTSWSTVGTHTGNPSNSVTDSYDVNDDIRYIQVVITEAKSNWWQIAEISWSPRTETTDVIEDGTYIIVNDTNKAMTNTASGSGFAYKTVTIDGTIATPVNSVYEWTFARQSDGTYYITDSSGAYLNINSSGITTSSTTQKITATISGGKVLLSNGDNGINYYASDGQIFSRWNTDTGDANNMQTLYKKLSSTSSLYTVALYNAIIKADALDNADGNYDSELFATLQTVLNESITLYQSASVTGTTVTQEQIDAQTEALLLAIENVKLSDVTISYIDIPIEILDFRADGVMFEYGQNETGKGLYELLTDTKFGGLTYAGETVDMPGETGDRLTADEWNGWVDDCKRIGLVEDYLVGGKPVYKEATVDYVAKLIAKGYFKDLSESVANWNSTISGKINDLSDGYDATSDTNSNLGSWADTLAKTSTDANGGTMTWTSITTCYDLAYYILNNMWRSTEATDGEDTYNKTVGERTTLRMLLDDEGNYSIDSTKEISYTDSYIYNTDFTTENTAETKFTPINDLGYESSNDYGDTTDTTEGTNYHYTIHLGGSFVYNADDDLYFYFDGDDDVYFYVNGVLVMDIGGAHSHCDDELHLNNVAHELGLVDGGIYTFDMFYAERHTTQANLEFKTNIKIMDTMSTTSKGQYDVSTGDAIPYGAIVNTGTTVAYSFELLNMRSVNVTDITFVDESLGTYLSEDSITLYDDTKTNGATTDITDIVVYYHTYDRPAPSEPGTLNNDIVQTKTVAQITELINIANANHTSLDIGSYMVTISSEDDLKALLALGVSIDTQIQVYGVKRNVVETDRPYINTVSSHAYYVSNGKRIALNGVASQKLTVLNSFKVPTTKEQIVVDYGKGIRGLVSEITKNIELNDGAEATFYGITTSGYHNQIRTNDSGIISALDTAYSPVTSFGTYYLRGSSSEVQNIEFNLNTFLADVEKVYAVYKIVDESLVDTAYEEYYVLVEVDIIPATNVYYETDFADDIFTFTKTSATTEENWDSVAVDADTELANNTTTNDGIQNDGTVGNNQTYGFDLTYADDAHLSDGSSYYVEGQGRTKTLATFSFTGTGFDLISRTGADQGSIRVDIYSDAAMTQREKAVTVLNKSETGLELYQIPVISVNTLEYGTHYVKIGVNAAYTDTTNASLSRGNQFYLDAIRIYNPMNVDATTSNATIAKLAYATDGELAPQIIEVREMLLDATTYESSVTSTDSTDTNTTGFVFVDKTKSGVDLATYAAVGPNNEVYLQPGNAIAFKVTAAGLLGGIDIGAKSADGNPVKLQITTSNAASNASASYVIEKDITSSTALYYDVLTGTNADINDYLNSDGEAYITISNTGEKGSILSITDIKVGYNDVPTATTFSVGDDVISHASEILVTAEPNYDIQSAKLSASSYSILKKVEMTVVTTTDVEKLVVKNKYGMQLSIQSTSQITEDGMKVWTVKYRSMLLGNQTFTVTGYGDDGTSGESVTVSARIKLF